MLMDEYAELLTSVINKIKNNEREKIKAAAEIVKDVISSDGLIYVFGCGHSHILSEETFYRAGGLACVSPIFYEPLMLHEGAALSSVLEKTPGLAADVLANVHFTEADMLICVSSSGINSVPVELADAVCRSGIRVVGVSSDEYLSQEAHNPLGKHLQAVCTLCINNYVPHGDACLSIEGLPVKMTPASTVASSYIINSILAEGTQLASAAGIEVPVYMSGNIPGGAEFNKKLIERYSKRIACL